MEIKEPEHREKRDYVLQVCVTLPEKLYFQQSARFFGISASEMLRTAGVEYIKTKRGSK